MIASIFRPYEAYSAFFRRLFRIEIELHNSMHLLHVINHDAYFNCKSIKKGRDKSVNLLDTPLLLYKQLIVSE